MSVNNGISYGVSILMDERERLENMRFDAYQRLNESAKCALMQRTVRDQNGNKRQVDYVDIDKFTPEQRKNFEFCFNLSRTVDAQICVFDNYIKSNASPSAIQSFNQHVTPLEEYKDVRIKCDSIDLDKEGNLAEASIRVGGFHVESPFDMSFREYTELYTSSLFNILLKSLGNNRLSQAQAMKAISSMCSEVYLDSQKPKNKKL